MRLSCLYLLGNSSGYTPDRYTSLSSLVVPRRRHPKPKSRSPVNIYIYIFIGIKEEIKKAGVSGDGK